jgi:hypothetical protein
LLRRDDSALETPDADPTQRTWRLARHAAAALRDLGVIRGSAVNNDGGGDGLTAPDPDAQKRLLRTAYLLTGDRAMAEFLGALVAGIL